MGNFIDKTFMIIANILLKILPASKKEKKAFNYYRVGMKAQSKGRYSEALENYYEALVLEEDSYDRSYILYNIGLIYGYTGKFNLALEFYHQALKINSNLPQAFYNIGIIYHRQGTIARQQALVTQTAKLSLSTEQYFEISEKLFDKAAGYWRQALKLAPDNYLGVRNWLKITGRLENNN